MWVGERYLIVYVRFGKRKLFNAVLLEIMNFCCIVILTLCDRIEERYDYV